MTLSYRRRLNALPLVLLVLLASAASPPAKPTAQQIAQWVRQLGDNNFKAREEASQKLWEAGQAAEAALQQALQSDDAEVVRRARDILDKFKWGIYPDTPAEIVALIQAYPSTDVKGRTEIVQKLLQAGTEGLQAVVKIAHAEADPNRREVMRMLLSQHLPAALPRILAEGRLDKFETLLELAYEGQFIDSKHYTAYWLLRGKLDDRIAQLRSLLDKTPTRQRLAETLVYLYRARGDRMEALKTAEKADRPDLVEGLLYEAADWKALAKRPDTAGRPNNMEKWGYRAAYARLAGDRKAFEGALATLSERSKKSKGPQRDIDLFTAAKAFLLNDRPAEGLALLAEIPEQHPLLFEILCARLEYGKAMALAEQPRPAKSQEQAQLDILKARTLYLLGENDKAQALFARLAERIKEGVALPWIGNLLETEYRIGLRDQAFEHCAKALSESVPEGMKLHTPGIHLSKVFPDRADSAEVWWGLLQQKFKDESTVKVLKRLRDLMDGKVPAKEVKSWIAEADRRPSLPRDLLALADVASTAGLDELARSLLEKADSSEALLRLGDRFAARKQWAQAAERYRRCWQKEQEKERAGAAGGEFFNPLSLYLAGDALVRAGQEKEGKQLIEQAHWVLLGDSAGRDAFVGALTQRGHAEAARRENDLLLRISPPKSFYSGSAVSRLASVAASRKDFLPAAEGYEQAMLQCLHTYTNFISPGAFAGVPARIHHLRARGLLAAGKYEEADKEIELALTDSPGNLDLTIALVPELESRGRKKEATALFERTVAIFEKLCEDYPHSGWAHNSAAWMSACCRRNLDKALEHANKAVALAPTHAGYLDTLAEVHFQRGDKDKAVALQKRVIELDPKKMYYRKQLRRLEAGNPAAERPAEDEE